jgi:hypothetical protein
VHSQQGSTNTGAAGKEVPPQEPIFRVVDKLNWQDDMAFDRDLSATDFRVGFAIGWATNKRTGRAFISQDAIAVKLGLNVRTVRRLIERLEYLGHLRVHRRDLGTRKSDGRAVCGGRVAHRYEPVIKSRTPAPSFQGHVSNKSRTQESSFAGGERRIRPTRKEDNFHTKGGLRSPPYPLNPIFNPNRARAADKIERRLQGADFEIWISQKLGCSHAEVIENISAKQLFAMQRRNSIGDDLGEELAEISMRLAAKRKDSV